MSSHLTGDPEVIIVTHDQSGKIHVNQGHPVVGTKNDVTGQLTASEAADVVAAVGLVGRIGTLAAAEAADVAAIAGLVGRNGVLAATEAGDTFAAAGTVTAAAISGTLAATESADEFAAAGTVAFANQRVGALAAVEDADRAAIAGIVVLQDVIGTLAATEAPDVAAFTDAEVVAPPIFIGGGGFVAPMRPHLVEGECFGILPRIEGEAHGIVANLATARGTLPSLAGELAGSIGTAGHSRWRLVVGATGGGHGGATGAAVAVLKGLSAAGKVDTTDDKAAAMTFLLAV